jgi:hypothetical protein
MTTNTAMHLTRLLQLPEAQQVPESAALCGLVMASVVNRHPKLHRIAS